MFRFQGQEGKRGQDHNARNRRKCRLGPEETVRPAQKDNGKQRRAAPIILRSHIQVVSMQPR